MPVRATANCPTQTILSIGEIGLSTYLDNVQASAGDCLMSALLEDHGLPLVQLKEQRRDLVVALIGRQGPLSAQQITEIASIQNAITAIEAVIDDLDAEVALRDQTA